MKANRIIFTGLLCFSVFFSTVDVFAQDSRDFLSDLSPDMSLMQSYLDTADQREVSEQWLDYARFGLESVLSSWEKEVLLLKGDDFNLAELRYKTEEDLNEVLKARYAEWLSENFFNSVDPPSLGALSNEIEELNSQYLYELQDDGSLVFKNTVNYSDVYTTDAMGNATLVQKGEKTLWVEGTKAKISALMDSWAVKMATAFSGLKASISDENLLKELESNYERDYESHERSFRDQLYRLYNTEQSRFARLRIYDQYSLEYESGQETASNVSNRLIEATEAGLDSRLDALVSSLNAQASAVDAEGGIVDADNWRESFSALLSRGLDSWDAAEQELLMKRIEWEQDASAEVSGGEDAWADAFYQLSEKRTAWMTRFRKTLEEGNLLWAEESRELEEAIGKAVAEIDDNIANAGASLQSRIDNLAGMLLQSVNMMRTARSSWEYWMDRFDEGEKGSFNTSEINFDYDSMIGAMSAVKPEISTAARNADSAYREALYWAGIFKNYQQYSLDSQQGLSETYGIVVFDNASLQTAFNGDELTGALIERDVLLDQDAWEAIYLDEYQVELLKARAYMQYWQKQQEIARAVYDYAADNSSTKETADETAAKLAGAKTAYEEVLAEYKASLDRMSGLSTDLGTLQFDMQTIQDEIDGYQQQLADARDQYDSTLTDLYVDNPAYLAGQFRDYYLQLLASMGMTEDSEESPSAALEAYLLAAKEYGLEEQISLVSERVTELLSGGENTDLEGSLFNPETTSLAGLRSRMQATSDAGFIAGGTAGEAVFGLEGTAARPNLFTDYLSERLLLATGDYRYDQLYGYFVDYHDADTDAEAKARLLWRMQLIVDDIRKENSMNYEVRLAALRLLVTNDFSEWSEQYFGVATDDPNELLDRQDAGGLTEISRAIEEDLKVYRELSELYEQSVAAGTGFEICEWGPASGTGLSENTRAQALQALWDYRRGAYESDAETGAAISEIAESLGNLYSWIGSLGSLDGKTDLLEAAVLNPDEALGQQYFKAYLGGNHNLVCDLGDMYPVLYSDSIEQESFTSSLEWVLEGSIDYAPALSAYGYEKSRTGLIDALEQFGVINTDAMNFIAPEAVWDGCGFYDAEEVAGFFMKLDTVTRTLQLPDYLSELLYSYTGELKGYFAVKAASVFPGQLSGDLAAINEQIQAVSKDSGNLSSVMQTIQKSNDQSVKLLGIATSDELPDELCQEAARRLVETAGFDLASDALALDGFGASDGEWSSLYEDYISATRTALGQEKGIEDFRNAITARAAELLELALALANPDSADWTNAPAEWLDAYSAMLWNSLDFDDALERITGSDSALSVPLLEQLLDIDRLMPESAEGFPSDVELQWLYGGNEVLREIDYMIVSGIPETWAADNFDLVETARNRYYSDAEMNELEQRLSLSGEESAAGMTVMQKATQLWNGEFSDGLLKAFLGLMIINNAIEAAGEYRDDYGFGELLAELTYGSDLSADDMVFLQGAASGPEIAIETWLDNLAAVDLHNLSGEALFWNLAWNLRIDAVEADYSQTAAREDYIFDDPESAAVIINWISEIPSADYLSYSEKLDALIETQLPEITALADRLPGEVYRRIAAYGFGGVLVERAGYTQAEAADFVNWFMDKKGLGYSMSAGALGGYLAADSQDRLYSLLEGNEAAAIHYLKKKISEGYFSSAGLEAVLESVDLTNDAEAELSGLQGMLDDIKVYNELLHGEFEDYLDSKYSNEDQKREARELYMRFMGSSNAQWDDSVFMLSAGSSTSAGVILEDLAFNRTRGTNNSNLNPETGVSANEVFMNEALLSIYEMMYNSDRCLSSELAGLQSERELQSRASAYLESLETADNDNWRSFLNEEYLSSEDGEPALVSSAAANENTEDYERDLQIGEDGGPAAIQDFDGLVLFSGTGDDQQNIILDAANSYLDSAAYLAAAIDSWAPRTESGLSTALSELNMNLESDGIDFWSDLEAMSYSDIEERYLYEINAGTENSYAEAESDFYSLTAGIESLKESLSNIGYRRERLIRMSSMSSDEQLAELKPLSDGISGLEEQIAAAQEEWQGLIDSPDGYRALEKEYAAVYNGASNAFDRLEQLKQEYSTAKSIHDYASAGYLGIDDEILGEFDPVESGVESGSTVTEDDKIEVASGITGGTIVASDVDVDEQTADQAYRNELLAAINKVSPAERLAYINEKLARARAASDALEMIINEGHVTESIYSRDEVYRVYFDNYLETFRESLVLNKINLVLNEAIARQETVTREALFDWNSVLDETYVTPVFLDSGGEATVPDGLESCFLNKNADGSWGISWDSTGSNAEVFKEYFENDMDSETGFSDFENDLMSWLETISGMMSGRNALSTFTTWAMSLKWEEYRAAGSPSSISDKFWSEYLNKNGEEDLDREGAKQKLVESWVSAYNEVNSYTGENKRLYNFYKMLEKGGIMQADLDSEGGNFGVTFDVLANRESIILANKYMTDEYHKDANALIIASIPMFAMAAVYYAAGVAALAVPFGWIGAILLFATAVSLTLGGALLAGEGGAKKAAAKHIEHSVVSPALSDISRFMQGYKRDTAEILEKKQIYEDEYAKLQDMKGAAAEGESLTDEKRIELMTTSTITAFTNECEDLHALLVQGGLIEENGSTSDDVEALEQLFGRYQNEMTQSGKDQCVNSSIFIGAMEEESQDAKQTAARELNDYLTSPNGVARQQAKTVGSYRNAYYQYLAEEITREEFEAAAEATFSNPVFSAREHLLRLYEKQAEIAEIIMGSDQFNAEISAELLEGQEILLCGNETQKGIYDYKMSNYRDVRMYELQMLQLEMNERYKNWENQMRAITARGELEWIAGERKLTRKYSEWRKEIRRLYNRQKETWSEKYLDFLGDKQAWLDAVTIQSTKTGDMSVLENFGEMTSTAIIAAGEDMLIGDFSGIGPDPDGLLPGVVDFELLDDLLENAQGLTDSINDIGPVIFTAAGPDRFTTSDSIQAIKDFQSVQNEEYEKHLAELEYVRMLEQVEIAEESFRESMEGANENVEESVNRVMREDGYTLNGNYYERQLVVGDTLGDYIYDDGYVSTYRDYTPEPVDFGKELKEAKGSVEGLDSEGLQGIVARAMEHIREQLAKIFGDDEETNAEIIADLGLSATHDGEKGSYRVERRDVSLQKESGVIESVVNWVSDKLGMVEDTEEEDSNRFADLSPGLFGKHVGYAPGFAENSDLDKDWDDEGQIKYEGLGEMGRIMGQFIFNKMREGAGWAEVNMPHYRKRLWDDTDSFIKAPSVADLSSMAVTICTLGAGGAGSALLTAAVNLSDDFALAAMDIGTGEKDILEGSFDFMKTAAVSLVGAELGELFGKIETGSLGDKLLVGAGQQASNNIVGSVVNSASLGLDEDGNVKFGYDLNTMEQGIFGKRAVAGYLGGVANMASGTGLNSLFEGSMTEVEQAFYGSLSSLGGIAAQQATEYGVHLGYQLVADGFGDIDGSITTAFDNMEMDLNVLDVGSMLDLAGIAGSGLSDDSSSEFFMNLGTVADNLKGTGLLALKISSQGVSGEITTKGINIGNSMYDLGKGFTTDMATRIYSLSHDGGEFLRQGYAFGDQAYENTIWRILFGKDQLIFDAEDGEAKTIKNGSGRDIHMNSAYAETTDEELYKAVMVLQHESYRDGVQDMLNDAETMRAVKAHTEIALSLGQAYGFDFMAGDENMIMDVIAYMTALSTENFDTEAFKAYVDGAYDSTQDFWKLTADGRLEYDGKANLYDEDGNLIQQLINEISLEEDGNATGKYVETGLARLLGITNQEAALLMANSGFNYSVEAGLDTLDTNNWYWNKNGGNNFNKGTSISLKQISAVYNRIGADESTVKSFMNMTYGSAVGMINKYGSYTEDVNSILEKAYDKSEIEKIKQNREWLNNAFENGIDTSLLVPGGVVTTGFAENTGILEIVSSSIEGAEYFSELHTGLDYYGGTSVNTPGGIWQLINTKNDKAYFQLFGSDVKMRIQHLDVKDIKMLMVKSFYGDSSTSVSITSCPTNSNGTGTGVHVHYDFTGFRLNDDKYMRGFLNTSDMMPGDQWNYPYSYYDKKQNVINGYPKNFYIY